MKYKHIAFDEQEDKRLLEELESQSNMTAYIKDLIRKDIQEKYNKITKYENQIEENIDRKFKNYTQTKAFKTRIKEVIIEEEIQNQINKYIEKELQKHLKTIDKMIKTNKS